MDDQNEAVDIVVKRDEAVTITFADGHVARFSIMELRLGCPCATCRNLRDHDEQSWPRPGSPTPLRITDAELHGAWGLQLTWNDGHATGIFPFEVLRHTSESQAARGFDSKGGRPAPSPPSASEPSRDTDPTS